MNTTTTLRTEDPAVTPRLLLSAAAAFAALVGPVWLPFVVAVGAGIVVQRSGDTATRRGAAWAVVGLMVGTLVLTPVWLHLLADIPLRAALAIAAALALRLGAVLAAGLALAAVVRPRTWIAATGRWPTVGLVLGLTLRQVPELAADARRIRTAQRGRGLLVGWGPWRPRALAVPLLQRGLERADRLANALILAGWGAKGRRPLHRTRFRASDLAWLLLAGALVGAAGIARINLT